MTNDTMKLRLPIWFLTVFLSASCAFSADLSKAASGFLRDYCHDCHDGDVSKGDLNLADLKFDPANSANFKTWQQVFERVRDDEMPPAKKPRPAKSDLGRFLADLQSPLLAADRSDIADRGRVRSRRLTRTEYEHTVHDLLGIDIPLKELLPEDPSSHGFETVAAGQQLSHHQLARYLDVADLALTSAFRRALRGDATFSRECSPEELAHRRGGNYRGPDLREGKSISWPMTLQFFGRMPVTQIRHDGWYRITLRDVHAINPGKDGAVWGTLRSGACSSSAPILYMIGLVEATAKPRDLVYEAWIQRGHQLELKPNDFELRRPRSGAKGGNVSFTGRDLEKDGYSGIANRGIVIERIYPNADRATLRRNLFGDIDLDEAKSNPGPALDKMVARFARRAFRRPVTTEQLAPYRRIARQSLAEGETPAEALHASYRAILCSPRFLTFIESPGQLNDHAIASRLSYALWVSMPDWTLTKLANEGKLRQPGQIAKQIDRMIAHKKFDRFIASFSDQWLRLKEIDFTSPDRRQFKTFDPVLQESMLQETRDYLTELIKADLGVDRFVDSDFAFLNGRLARHYEIEMDAKLTPGRGLQKVVLDKSKDSVRGGLLTQGAILKVTADGTTTSPVIRGVFVNERILGQHIPPPPPGVPAIEPDIRGAVSIRDQLDKHRSNESCYSCHITIDPPGLALESFDPVGRWRTRYGRGMGAKVDPTGETPDGERFADILGWKKIYASRHEQLARAFATHFLTYATGAPPRFSDHETIEDIVTKTKDSGHGVRSILHACLESSIFRRK
jgi:hypothetical protein